MNTTDLSTHQIIFIENRREHLYGELIQVIEDRGMSWIRPLALVQHTQDNLEPTVLDLRDGPDVICPTPLLRAALDTQWLPIWVALQQFPSGEVATEAHAKLRALLRAVVG
ncbi:MAG: hypothetical protein IGR92_10780 [Leptolyngbyaceae cyanobacterium T60_A2020_046]|nr:hypothetical protein [Leptolyngbyaceae cyanobacterium T60_A2020_046]